MTNHEHPASGECPPLGESDTPRIVQPSPERDYSLMGWVALLVILLVLTERGPGLDTLIPLLVGCVGLVFRWQLGPLFLLGALMYVYAEPLEPVRGRWQASSPPVLDMLLSMAMLVYCIAHYRLVGLARQLVPRTPFLPPPVTPKVPARRIRPLARSPLTATRQELLQLAVVVPAVVVLAQLVWAMLPYRSGLPGVSPSLWRTILLVWLLAVSALVLANLLGHLRWRQLSPWEAQMFLQDTVWQETRHEQRRLARWLAWKRIQSGRKERS